MKRNFQPDVKSAIATTSSKAGITVKKASCTFQATCEVFCKSKYYLSIDDVGLLQNPESENAENPTHAMHKRPHTSKDWERYKYVLPSAHVINKEKHLQAIQVERNCALAILDPEPEDGITVHYDTTLRRRIRGKWASLIVKISNGECFQLRPLSLALKNRQTITELLVEEFKRLAKVGNSSATMLWEKVTTLMTDSVSKNLHIEESIAAMPNFTHIPFQLICVSHTCEVFDRGNICVLQKAEQLLGLREALLARMPAL